MACSYNDNWPATKSCLPLVTLQSEQIARGTNSVTPPTHSLHLALSPFPRWLLEKPSDRLFETLQAEHTRSSVRAATGMLGMMLILARCSKSAVRKSFASFSMAFVPLTEISSPSLKLFFFAVTITISFFRGRTNERSLCLTLRVELSSVTTTAVFP